MSARMGGRPYWSSVLPLAVLATSACAVAVDPIEVPQGCPDMPLRGPRAVDDVPLDFLIDDFEDGDSMIAAVSGRNGVWTSMSNGSSTMLFALPSSSCAGRGSWAGHFVAAGFADWGASVTAYLVAQTGLFAIPYDGSHYGGFSFWAATGSTRDATPIELGFSTMDTVSNGGVCTSCYDYYRVAIQLTHSWKRFAVRFADLEQAGTGKPQVPEMNTEKLVGFVIWPQKQLDMWIDDLRFEP
jgi:hypothetical protein